MPRYFLHAEYFGRDPIADEEGADFENVDAATVEARQALRELLAASIKDSNAPVPSIIRVVDDHGNELNVVFAREFVPLQLR